MRMFGNLSSGKISAASDRPPALLGGRGPVGLHRDLAGPLTHSVKVVPRLPGMKGVEVGCDR
jgi:hypothetical protein